jgi:drug/metabolite transporter (DMT)-like permease
VGGAQACGPAAPRSAGARLSTPAGALVPPRVATAGRGILCALAAWLLFAGMDAGSKQLAESYSIVQILWLRFIALTLIAAWLAHRQGGGAALRTRHLWLQSARSLLLVVEIGLFILAITVLPLANAHAIIAVTPLLVTALSVPLLGERVGLRRWSAGGFACVGVLSILRRGWGVVQAMWLVLLCCALVFAL